MKSKRGSLVLIVLAAVVGTVFPLVASDDEAPGGDNVMITVRILDEKPGGETVDHSYRVLSLDGRSAELLTGWRYPIPTSEATAAANVSEVTSFSYQNVGVSANIDTRIIEQDRIQLRGVVEISDVEPGPTFAGRAAPKLGTFRHRFHVVLADGASQLISQVPKPGGGSASLELTAQILD